MGPQVRDEQETEVKRRNWKVGQLEGGCRGEWELAFAQDGRGGLGPHSSNWMEDCLS